MSLFKYSLVFSALVLGVNLALVISPNDNSITITDNRALETRSLLSSFVGNLMSRSYGVGSGSQMVSVNLTNLLVLILLKALIFAAGTLGASALKEGYYHRKEEPQSFLSNDEMLLYLSFLTGQAGNNGCLQYVACRDPEFAMKYKNAGDALLQTSKMLEFNTDARYDYVLSEIQEAIDWGAGMKNCNRFECNPNKQ